MRQINVCVNSTTYMSYYMLPRLLKRKARSAIINISSSTHYNPGGMIPVYSAVKSYNYSLSMAMLDAYGKTDKIDVMTVNPDATKSQMNSGRYLWAISAERHAAATINHLGW